MSHQIYIDMDGVVSDFDQAIENIFGEGYSNKIADTFWKKTCVEAEAFRNMPPIGWGLLMVKKIEDLKIPFTFMASTGGMPHHIDIAKQKLDWLHNNNLGSHPVAFCMNTTGKGRFASPGTLLIDDRQKVVDEWIAHGGEAMLFKPDGETVRKIVGAIEHKYG